VLWSQTVPAPLRGVSLARERDVLLAWDGQNGLFLFDHHGKIQAQRPNPALIAVAGSADDGSAFIVAEAQAPVIN